MISAATRESAHPKKMANGFCLAAIRCLKCTSWCGWARSSAMKRALPVASTRHASSGVRGRLAGVRCGSVTAGTLPAVVGALGARSEQAGALADRERDRPGDGGEEVVALVVDHDERGEVLDLD